METKGKSSKIIIGLVLGALFLTVIIGGLIVNKNNKAINQLSSENLKLETVVQERDSMVNEFITTFDSIESSLTFINQRRGQLSLNHGEMNRSQTDAIIADIELMNQMLEESSAKIAQLEKDLKNSGYQLSSFKKKVASLNKKIEQQNQLIAELQYHVEEQEARLAMVTYENDSLKYEVMAFQDTISKKDEMLAHMENVIGQQISEINKGFYTYGTTKELTSNGVIAKQGGFLGLGKIKTIPTGFNQDYFTQIDIIEDRSIELNAKKVKLISEHPAESYKLIEEDGLITRLEIETPQEFWKMSQYAVIEVKM